MPNPYFSELEHRPNRGLLKLAYPLIIAMSIQTGFNVVDTIFVGRLGADAIASVSLAYPVQMIMIAIAGGLGVGAQSIISRAIGSKNYSEANNAAEHSLVISVFCGVATAIIGMLSINYIISGLGATDEVTSLSLSYLHIVLLGSIFIYLTLSIDAILRGEGNTKRSMIFMGISALLNVIMDPILIFSLDFGVRGAAIATVLARGIVAFMMLNYILFKKESFLKLELKEFKFSSSIIKDIIGIGIPTSLSHLSYSLSLFVMNSILAFYSSDAIATFGIGFRIESMAFLPMFGLAGALVSAIGYFKGAKHFEKLISVRNFAYLITILFMCICALIFLAIPEHIYGIFTDSSSVIGMGRTYLLINIIVYPIVPFSIISRSGFQGLGKGFPPLIIALLRSWIIVIPLSWYFAVVAQQAINYVWWSMVIGNAIASTIGGIWFYMESKKLQT